MDLLSSNRKEYKDDFEYVLTRALQASGFSVFHNKIPHAPELKMDILINTSTLGAATSTVDATYCEYFIENRDSVLSAVGANVYFKSCDAVEPVQYAHAKQPHAWVFRGVILARGYMPVSDMQTVYLAMQGIYVGLPAFSSLSDKQRDMVKNQIDMLADYLRK